MPLVYTQDGPKLRSEDSVFGDHWFQGSGVAISADAQYVFVGAPGKADGAVVIYTKVDDDYVEAQLIDSPISNSGHGGGAGFGFSIACADDGSRFVVGARNAYPTLWAADPTPLSPVYWTTGTAFVYVKDGATWELEQEILGSVSVSDGPGPRSYYGYAVDMSADGAVVAVGGPYDGPDDPIFSDSGPGACWIWRRLISTWTEEQKLVGAAQVNGSTGGWSVSLSSDGEHVAYVGVGNVSGIHPGVGPNAWLWEYVSGSWVEEGTFDSVGGGVALNADGSFMAVSDPYDAPLGNVTIYRRVGGVMGQVAVLAPEDAETTFPVSFGHSISLTADGLTAVIGAYDDDSLHGAVWVFSDEGDGAGWLQRENKYTPSDWVVGDNPDGVTQEEPYWGYAVRVTPDGQWFVGGAPYDDNDGDDDGPGGSLSIDSGVGAAWVFHGPSGGVASLAETVTITTDGHAYSPVAVGLDVRIPLH